MDSRYLYTVSMHFLCVFLLIRTISFIAPCCVNSIITLFLTLLIGYNTLNFTKQKWLSDRVQPYGKAVFITGCDSGFGKATAQQLDSMGFHVFAGCLSPTDSGALELKSRSSKTLEIVELDVTKEDSVKAALEFVKEHLGQSEFWALINNAGVLKGSSFVISGLQDYKDCIEVNVYGPIRMAKAFLPLLRQSKGRIINVTSAIGRTIMPYSTPYVISKHAEVAFNDCLRQELDAWKVSVISVEPDFYQTRLISKETAIKSTGPLIESLTELNQMSDAEEHLRNVEAITGLFLELASKNTDTVVDEIESAVLSEYPQIIYKVRRNVVFRFIVFLMETIPLEVLDFFLNLLMREKSLTLFLSVLKPWL